MPLVAGLDRFLLGAAIVRADSSGDGRINYREFTKMVRAASCLTGSAYATAIVSLTH